MSVAEDKLCLFCLENGLVDPFVMTTAGYLLEPLNPPIPGSWLIIPKTHIIDDRFLPALWQTHRYELLQCIPWINDYDRNSAINIGREAGQTVEHIHEWVIPRHDEPLTSLARRKGASTAIALLNGLAT